MFQFLKNEFYVENIPVQTIAEKVKTPFYLYSQSQIENNFKEFRLNAEKYLKKSLVCFAVKSNPNLAVLNVLARLGAGADIVSGGELLLALKAGISAEKIVFSGVGKTFQELELAVLKGIKQINLESEEEAILLDEIAQKHQKTIKVALRINPDIDAKTHDKITTGKKENKFGIAWQEAQTLYPILCEKKGIELVGIDVHVGSQLLEKQPFEETFNRAVEIITFFEKQGIKVQTIDVGGGVGVAYEDGEVPLSIEEYMQLVASKLEKYGCEIIFEPGRYIVAQAGVLVSEVVRVKKTQTKKFVVLDAGMNDLMRPALYDAYHGIQTLTKTEQEEAFDIVGPVCESSDVFAKNRLLSSDVKAGDFVAIQTAGAYGASMASTYNFRPLCAEVLACDDKFEIVKKEQSFEEMIALYTQPSWL